MLKIYCDFNDFTDDNRYWILLHDHRPLVEVADQLGLKHGDRVLLFQDAGDFKVEANLLFDQSQPDCFRGTLICARPDWATQTRFPTPTIRPDDLTGELTRALLALHLAGMHANSPHGSVFALDLSGLQTPDVTVWTAWRGDDIAGVGAMKALPDGSGELKSMRTHPDHLRQGVAAAILEHIIGVARSRGYRRLSLETGSGPAFDPALDLYRRRGFVDGEAFSDYERSAFNQFLHLDFS